MTGNRPVHELKMGRIRAAVWANVNEGGTTYSVTFSRLYKDEATGQWADSSSFNASDLLLVAKVADHAHSWILAERSSSADKE